MKITETSGDVQVLLELGKRMAHRRVEAGFTQAELARESGVSKRTVERLEAGNSVQLANLVRVLRRLSLLGSLDSLLPPAKPGPMELLERGKPRQRVKPDATTRSARKTWTWGDES